MLNKRNGLLRGMVQASKRFLTTQKIKNILSSPLLYIILSFLYPSVYLIGINRHIYTSDQIVVTFIFIFMVSLITTFILGISIHYLVKIILPTTKYFGFKGNDDTVSPKLYRALLSSVGTLILLVLLHGANRELIPILTIFFWGPFYLIVSFGAGILTYRYQLTLLNLILGVLIAINGAGMLFNGSRGELINFDTKGMEQNVIFKQKPNVYLVILESYASLDIREQIYGINNDSLMRELNQSKYVTSAMSG